MNSSKGSNKSLFRSIFDPVTEDSMPRKAIERSRTLGPELRRRREELGLTLREVVSKTAEAGSPIPFSTLAKIEQGKVDPGVLRLHHILKIYDLPMQVAEDLLDLEELASELPGTRDPERLLERGRELWNRGDLEHGLAYFVALRQRVSKDSPLWPKALLAFSGACSRLGKFRLTLHLLEDALLMPLDADLRVTAYVQAAMAWDGLGSPDVALAFVDRGAKHLRRGNARGRAWLFHKKAGVHCGQGEYDEARESLALALRAYRKAGDTYGLALALGLESRILRETGDPERAADVAREARSIAARDGFERVATLRALDEGIALVQLGRTEDGLNALRGALAAGLSHNDRVVQFYAHYYLAEACERSGDHELARVERDAARYFARFVDESTPETRALREERRNASSNP
jgi:tetratricopeptide (TPR) repeat protein